MQLWIAQPCRPVRSRCRIAYNCLLCFPCCCLMHTHLDWASCAEAGSSAQSDLAMQVEIVKTSADDMLSPAKVCLPGLPQGVPMEGSA